jgi:hypothetical protein
VFATPFADERDWRTGPRRRADQHRRPHFHEHVRRDDRVRHPARAQVLLRLPLSGEKGHGTVRIGDLRRDEDELTHSRILGGVDEVAIPFQLDGARIVISTAMSRVRRRDHDVDSLACRIQRRAILEVAAHDFGARLSERLMRR